MDLVIRQQAVSTRRGAGLSEQRTRRSSQRGRGRFDTERDRDATNPQKIGIKAIRIDGIGTPGPVSERRRVEWHEASPGTKDSKHRRRSRRSVSDKHTVIARRLWFWPVRRPRPAGVGKGL